MANFRVYVEKKQGFNTLAENLKKELNENLQLTIKHLRIINIYDVFSVKKDELELIKKQVLSEEVTDIIHDSITLREDHFIAYELIPGQYDQRADSAEQCIKLICSNQLVRVKSGMLIILEGSVSFKDLQKVKHFIINPVEMCEKDLDCPLELNEQAKVKPVEIYHDFNQMSKQQLNGMILKKGLAMNLNDLIFIQDYFKNNELRNPTETELAVLDTYWSDHCRHTTFQTILSDVLFPNDAFHQVLQDTFNDYLELRKIVHGKNSPMTLMDLATIKAKTMLHTGELNDLELSDEINASSIYIDVKIDEKIEKWLLQFKNETHNHPTEIEPFGGAATCIGGAIRDPLSGRAYVYQAMRVSGSGNILEPFENTLIGKLPQRKISQKAAEGYSSYGNEIGVATTHVREIYHEGYKAKHMEVGVVVGAVKASHIKRETPINGDLIILIGGKTGRDGIGGATGSSKAHNERSIETACAEVQKGNAPIERKIQRLFRNPDVTKLIKKSNDFGAGGISVAIGELADGLEIYLDQIPTKYAGLNPTELAISESQERIAVVVSKEDVDDFCKLANMENLDATIVAKVTCTNRLIMKYKDVEVVNLSRTFLNSNGIRQIRNVEIDCIKETPPFDRILPGKNLEEQFLNNLKDQNIASQKGLVEMFDSTIGATTVLMPYGGKYQLTEVDASVQKIPVLTGNTDTCSILTYGFNPKISSWSPFHGAIYAIIESVAKFVAVGGDYKKIRFSFQEYFKRLGTDAKNWGLPFAALLGAIYVENKLSLPAIGGKDSMSGSFDVHHVPPTLISFAVGTEDAENIISPEFKEEGNYVYWIKHEVTDDIIPEFDQLKANYKFIYENTKTKNIISAFALKEGGLGEAIAKMSFGNKIGVKVENGSIEKQLFQMCYGSLVIETKAKINFINATYIGRTIKNKIILAKDEISMDTAIRSWSELYEPVHPSVHINEEIPLKTPLYSKTVSKSSPLKVKPKVLIPVFPGINCEYDSMKAFHLAGASPDIFVFKNRHQEDIEASIDSMVHRIDSSQILMLSGGFSAGDEPDGAGKFITAILLNQRIRESIENFLMRDGLILGICNGFQALIKSGLLPYGEIGKVMKSSPTLTRNDVNRHVSKIIQTRVTSTKSPWLAGFNVGEVHKIGVSHGEGKFVAPKEIIEELIINGQIATQYVDFTGSPSNKGAFNVNGSYNAIEGITSKDGRVFGKMGHSERSGTNLYKNISGNKKQDIFINGVNYFK